MDDISKQIEEVALKMEKSVQNTEFSMDILKATVIKLGPEGLKKAFATLSDEQKEMLKTVLEDMKKSHKQLIPKDKKVTLEPTTNSTPIGDYIFNEDHKPEFTEHDEKVADEAHKKDQETQKQQGGGAPVEGWEGQVIKSEEGIMEKNCDGGMSYEDMAKKHKKFKKKMKKLAKAMEEMEKGGSGSGRKPISPGLEGVASVKNMRERTKESEAVAAKFPGRDASPEQAKHSAKKNLAKMMKRMQDRKMEKSVCVAALAKSLEVAEDKVAVIWDQLAKAESYKYDDGTTGEAPKEATQQSKVPAQMSKGEEAGVHDPEDPSNPKWKDKAAKSPSGEKKPESGSATETADETMSQVPSTMGHKGDMKKSDFWHEEEEVYLAKSADPFKVRSHGQNAAYKVDELIHLEDESKKQRLVKSTFDYISEEDMEKAKKMKKGDSPEAEAAAQAKQNMKVNAQSAKDEQEAQRNARVDEKLTRIEERAGPHVDAHMMKSDDEHLEEVEKAFGKGTVDKLLKALPDTLEKGYEGFKKLEGKLKGKVSDPGAVAASIGRKKYGKEKFEHAAETDHKMKNMKPMKKSSVINDLIEAKVDMDDAALELAKSIRDRVNQGAFLVKSFSDEEMDAAFTPKDTWK